MCVVLIQCASQYSVLYQLIKKAYICFGGRYNIQHYIDRGQRCLVICKLIAVILGRSNPLFSFKPVVMINTIECFVKTIEYKSVIVNELHSTDITKQELLLVYNYQTFFPSPRLCIVLVLQMSMSLRKNQHYLNSPRRVQDKSKVILFKFSMNIQDLIL